jgi:hypothetical protein
MDNHIISILQNFEKPDHVFLKDKECLICLESFDLESNKFVQFPCKCSNSVYHIDCILKLINSGANKNFCPHCKSIYEIPLQVEQIPVAMNQIVPYNVINIQLGPDINYERIKNFTHILVSHIISNSIMNIINIVVSRDWAEINGRPELQVLILFYFCKLFFNYVILMYSNNVLFSFGDLTFRVIIEYKMRNTVNAIG